VPPHVLCTESQRQIPTCAQMRWCQTIRQQSSKSLNKPVYLRNNVITHRNVVKYQCIDTSLAAKLCGVLHGLPKSWFRFINHYRDYYSPATATTTTSIFVNWPSIPELLWVRLGLPKASLRKQVFTCLIVLPVAQSRVSKNWFITKGPLKRYIISLC